MSWSRCSLFCLGVVALLLAQCGLTPHPIYRAQPAYKRAPVARPAPPAATPTTQPMAVTPEAFPASLSDVQRCLQSTAEKYLGTPYRRGGTDRNGFDCSGFVLTVCGECRGIKLPRTAEEMFRAGTSVAREELRLGDLVFYSTGLHSIDHVGMCLGDGRFIHASSSDGVTINGLDEEYYRTRYRGAVRLGP